MVSDFDQLRVEHAEILAIASAIGHMLNHPIHEKAVELQALVAELVRVSVSHVMLENRYLYYEMLLSPHDQTREMAQQHITSFGNLASGLGEFAHQWQTPNHILAAAEKFCADTRSILHALTQRIHWEEQMFYSEMKGTH